MQVVWVQVPLSARYFKELYMNQTKNNQIEEYFLSVAPHECFAFIGDFTHKALGLITDKNKVFLTNVISLIEEHNKNNSLDQQVYIKSCNQDIINEAIKNTYAFYGIDKWLQHEHKDIFEKNIKLLCDGKNIKSFQHWLNLETERRSDLVFNLISLKHLMPRHDVEELVKNLPNKHKRTYVVEASDIDQQEMFEKMFGNNLVPDMNRSLDKIPLSIDSAGVVTINPCVIVHEIKVLIKETSGTYENIGTESQVFLKSTQEHDLPKNATINQEYASVYTFSRYKEYPNLKKEYGSLAGKTRKCLKVIQSVHPLKKADRTENAAIFLGFKSLKDLNQMLTEKNIEKAKGFSENLEQYDFFNNFVTNDIIEDQKEIEHSASTYTKAVRNSLQDSFFEKHQISIRDADDALIEAHYKDIWGIEYAALQNFVAKFIKKQIVFFSLLDTISIHYPDALRYMQDEIRILFKEIHMDSLLYEQDAESVYKTLMRQASRNSVIKWLSAQMPERKLRVSLQKIKSLFLENK